MAIQTGQLNATIQLPHMRLPYLVWVQRPVESLGTGMQPKISWTQLNTPVRCTAFPIRDEIFFLQSGAESISQIEFHFRFNQDIRIRDRILFLDDKPPVGDPGAWFEIQTIMRPKYTLRYTRAFGRVADPPGKG